MDARTTKYYKNIVSSFAAGVTAFSLLAVPYAFAEPSNTASNASSSSVITSQANNHAVQSSDQVVKATNDSTTTLTVDNAMPGDKFEAVRIIETTIDGSNGLVRKFASGFSFGSNAADRDDNGLSAYSALTDSEAIADASESIRKQITDNTVKYLAEEKDGKAVFENLPMGQYLVNGYSADGRYIVHNMIATVEPQATSDGSAYVLSPVSIVAKNDDNDNPPVLEIDKKVDKKSYTRGDANPAYTVNVKQMSLTTSAHNLYVSDKIDDEAIAKGLRINKDVVLKYADGTEASNIQVQYENNADGRPVGFTIYIPGEFKPGSELIVSYTGDISTVENHQKNLVNTAKTHSDDVSDVADDEVIEYEYDDGLLGTGDKTPYVIGGIVVLAAAAGVIVFVTRRNRDEE